MTTLPVATLLKEPPVESLPIQERKEMEWRMDGFRQRRKMRRMPWRGPTCGGRALRI